MVRCDSATLTCLSTPASGVKTGLSESLKHPILLPFFHSRASEACYTTFERGTPERDKGMLGRQTWVDAGSSCPRIDDELRSVRSWREIDFLSSFLSVKPALVSHGHTIPRQDLAYAPPTPSFLCSTWRSSHTHTLDSL